MDEQVLPWSANLGWTIRLSNTDRDFVGRGVVENTKDDDALPVLVGLVLEDSGVLRAGQSVFVDEQDCGQITSGTYSPSLEKSIALARVSMSVSDQCTVRVRNKMLRARVVKPAFVRQGKSLI